MYKSKTLKEAVDMCKAIISGEPSMETAGGKGASLEDAQGFSPSMEDDDDKKKKKKKGKKNPNEMNWEVPGAVPK